MLCNWNFTSVHPEVDPFHVSPKIAQCKMNANENKDLGITSNILNSL